MIEVVEGGWGDWWVLRDGIPLAVHLLAGSSERTRATAERHATTLAGDLPVITRPLGGRDQAATTR